MHGPWHLRCIVNASRGTASNVSHAFEVAGVKERFLPVVVRNVPPRRAEAAYPQALHVQDRARVHDEPAVVALGDGAQLVPEQDRRRLVHCFEKVLVRSESLRARCERLRA